LRVGKFHIDHLKKFMPRTKSDGGVREEGRQLAEWSKLHREFCKDALDQAMREKRAMMSGVGLFVRYA
jgi:hypothetical protein